MKKLFIVMSLLLIPSLVFADSTSWIKGGGSWGDLSDCSADAEGNQSCDDDLDTEDEFFFQVSPINIRKKINKGKLGVRFEPWMGYSEQKVSLENARFGNVIDDPNNPAVEAQAEVVAVDEIVAQDAIDEVIEVVGVAGADAQVSIAIGQEIQAAIAVDDELEPAIVAGVTVIEPAIVFDQVLISEITLNFILVPAIAQENNDPDDPTIITRIAEPAVLAGIDDVRAEVRATIFDVRNTVFASVDVPAVLATIDDVQIQILATVPSVSAPAVIEVIAVPASDAIAAVIGVPAVVGIGAIAGQDGGTITVGEALGLNDLKFKNIQLGMNMFLDYTVMKNVEVYGGPFVGFEVSKIAYRQEKSGQAGDTTNTETQGSTRFDTGVFWGGEFGAEVKVFDVVALGGFMQVLKHEGDIYNDLGISNQGTETRVGAGLTYYW